MTREHDDGYATRPGEVRDDSPLPDQRGQGAGRVGARRAAFFRAVGATRDGSGFARRATGEPCYGRHARVGDAR